MVSHYVQVEAATNNVVPALRNTGFIEPLVE